MTSGLLRRDDLAGLVEGMLLVLLVHRGLPLRPVRALLRLLVRRLNALGLSHRSRHCQLNDLYIPTNDQTADILTKALPSVKVKHFATALGLMHA